MNIYTYKASLLCEQCGKDERTHLHMHGLAPKNVSDESSFDSDEFPKGPSEEGESDTPSYCDNCGFFLESALTTDGENYVRSAVESFELNKQGNAKVIEEWKNYYSYLF